MAKRNGGIIGPSNVPTGQYGGTASGVWRLRDAFNYQKAGLWPGFATYSVGNSLRFNSGSSDNLSRTPANASNRQTWTWSGWVKLVNLNTAGGLFYNSNGALANGHGGIYIENDNTVWFAGTNDGVSYSNAINTNAVLRDVSAWYHIVVVCDTTNATQANRQLIYINSVLQTVTVTQAITQNANLQINRNTQTNIGVLGYTSPTAYLNGYIAEINFVDGQALTPSSFGKTDSATGIWTPLPYYGTFGTNGFYLKFANSAALGTDSSGNGNTWTANNLTSVDQSTDTPTNNFATLNPLFPQNDSLAFTNGNLQAVKPSGSATGSYYGNFGVSTGKWYWEMKCNAVGGNDQWIGIGQMKTLTPSDYPGNNLYTVAAGSSGEVRYNGTTVSSYTMASWTAGDIIMVALDMDNSRVYWGKNGTWQDSGDPVTGTNPYTNATIFDGNFIFPVGSLYQSNGDVAYNFGSPSFTIVSGNADANGYGNFEYAVPAGYYSLNTKNLATYG